jgi:hypothetical protein
MSARVVRRLGALARVLAPALVAAIALTLFTRPALAGYTHYWRWRVQPEPAAMARCVDDMSRIVEARRGMLIDSQGRTGSAAVFRTTQPFALGDAGAPLELPALVFNGIGDDGHEAFGFPLAPFTADDARFQFTKTAAKPYDVVAAACLIAARDCFPRETLAITSDGEWPGSFTEAAGLYERTLGRTARNPLDPPTDVLPPPKRPPSDDGSLPSTLGSREPAGRKRVLLVVIAMLGLAIGFVLTREAR